MVPTIQTVRSSYPQYTIIIQLYLLVGNNVGIKNKDDTAQTKDVWYLYNPNTNCHIIKTQVESLKHSYLFLTT